ncbi:hypothetical protein GCM10018965_020340 [Nonomuraea roseola]
MYFQVAEFEIVHPQIRADRGLVSGDRFYACQPCGTLFDAGKLGGLRKRYTEVQGKWYDSPEYRRAREIREGKVRVGMLSPRARRPRASPSWSSWCRDRRGLPGRLVASDAVHRTPRAGSPRSTELDLIGGTPCSRDERESHRHPRRG